MPAHRMSQGHTLVFLIAVLIGSAPAQAPPKYKVLQSLDGAPWGGVMLDPSGNVYGTTAGGGSGNCRYGCGTVFELSPLPGGNWVFSVLYDFTGGTDGEAPYGTLVVDASDNIYGTTTSGGQYNAGTAFELVAGPDSWTETTIYAFCPKIGKSGCEDGGGTQAGLAWDQEGNLYGTKSGGGTVGGEIFELAPGSGGWSEAILHRFQPSYYRHPAPGGSNPYAGLILDASGNLYGTTAEGGANCSGWSCGVVYELTRKSGGGWKEIVLHRFHSDGKDGVTPGWGALFMDGSGSLYGTTRGGGVNECGGGPDPPDGPRAGQPLKAIGNCGTIFRLTKAVDGRWKETILYSFKSGSTGSSPNTGLVMDRSGTLYGTTDYGGSSSGCGVIYKLAPHPKGKWEYTVLHSFTGNDGCLPEGNLVLDQKGNLYGGTVLGGGGYGVIFELTP